MALTRRNLLKGAGALVVVPAAALGTSEPAHPPIGRRVGSVLASYLRGSLAGGKMWVTARQGRRWRRGEPLAMVHYRGGPPVPLVVISTEQTVACSGNLRHLERFMLHFDLDVRRPWAREALFANAKGGRMLDGESETGSPLEPDGHFPGAAFLHEWAATRPSR